MAAFLDNPVGSINDAIGRATVLGVPLASFRPVGPPSTKTRSSLALTLHVQPPGKAARIIGAVDGVKFGQSRGVDEEFEVNQSAQGLPVDLIPQTVANRTITVDRFDLYVAVLEELLGTDEIVNLSDQYLPLVFREVWRDPTSSGFFTSSSRAYVYTGVLIKEFGRDMRSNDPARLVKANATFVYKQRFRVV